MACHFFKACCNSASLFSVHATSCLRETAAWKNGYPKCVLGSPSLATTATTFSPTRLSFTAFNLGSNEGSRVSTMSQSGLKMHAHSSVSQGKTKELAAVSRIAYVSQFVNWLSKNETHHVKPYLMANLQVNLMANLQLPTVKARHLGGAPEHYVHYSPAPRDPFESRQTVEMLHQITSSESKLPLVSLATKSIYTEHQHLLLKVVSSCSSNSDVSGDYKNLFRLPLSTLQTATTSLPTL